MLLNGMGVPPPGPEIALDLLGRQEKETFSSSNFAPFTRDSCTVESRQSQIVDCFADLLKIR